MHWSLKIIIIWVIFVIGLQIGIHQGRKLEKEERIQGQVRQIHDYEKAIKKQRERR